MEEIRCSIHNYTNFSGFPYSFYDMAQAALDCGLEAVITTDKNIYPVGHDQFFYRSEKGVLVVCGEELFDPISESEPHYLSIGISKEQFNRKLPDSSGEIRIMLNEIEDNRSFRHIELINAQILLEQGLSYGMKNFQENIKRFDRLLQTDQRYIGLAGTCSSEKHGKYNYQELFSTVCNHILSDEPLNGDLIHDKLLLLKKIRTGNLYFALDGIRDANGFRFSAEGNNSDVNAYPGDTIHIQNSITLKITCPESCTCTLYRNGIVLKEWLQCKQIPFTIYEPGCYRIECSLTIRRTEYKWIVSNPIFVVKG